MNSLSHFMHSNELAPPLRLAPAALQPPALDLHTRAMVVPSSPSISTVPTQAAPALQGYNWRASLDLLARNFSVCKRHVRSLDELYCQNRPFDRLYLINSGLFKIVSLTPDGRQRSTDFFFEGDWLGFDGMATGRHSCSAVALDIGEVWSVHYEVFLQAACRDATLMHHVLGAVSAQLARNREFAAALGALSVDARVADFLLKWANALAQRGRRTDQICLRMSREDMGSYLGMRLESVSRSLSKLAQYGLIAFHEKCRRDISIADVAALRHFVDSDYGCAAGVLH